MRLFALACAACALFACEAPEARIEETLVAEVRVSGEPVSDSPLRLAVLWLVQGESGQDVVVSSLDEPYDGAEELRLEFEVPPDVELTRLKYLDLLEVRSESPVVPQGYRYPVIRGYRPRVVIYQDLDEDGSFDAPALSTGTPSPLLADASVSGAELDAGTPASDRLVRTDDGQLSVVAFVDPEAEVEAMRLQDAQRFYELVGGLRRFGYSGPGGVELTVPGMLNLTTDTPVRLETELLCGRFFGGRSGTTKSEVFVDVGLDAVAICGLEHDDCSSLDMAATSVDWELDETDGRAEGGSGTMVQCKHNSLVEALHVLESTTVCQACYCGTDLDVRTYVVRRTKIPSWWPCGEEVPFCDFGATGSPSVLCPPAAEGYLDAGVHSRPLKEAGAELDSGRMGSGDAGMALDERGGRDM